MVDDDATLLAVARRLLSGRHDVEVFTSSRAALERLRAAPDVDVVLCDIIMPELGGDDLYAELSHTHPDLCERIIFWTGDAYTDKARAFLRRVSNQRLEKPFDAQSLRELVGAAVAVRHPSPSLS